jgi:hypothetical protein
MATRSFGTGYDPNSGWPVDDSTGIPWDSEADLYGRFGPGGFTPNPKLTGPVTGPSQGLSLSGPSVSDSLTARPATPADAAAMGGPQMTSSQPNLRPGMSPAVRTGPGPYTDVTPNADGFTPSLWGAAAKAFPYAARVLGPLGVYFGSTSPAETGELPRQTLGRRPSGPAAPTPAVATPMPARPVTPTPTAATPMPARPVTPTPAKAGPAAAKQRPNLGLYDNTITRPNMDVVQGGRNNPGQQTQMGVADWSKLFQRPQQ